ncbi:MAG: hypothetical protein QG670_1779 [Thermoproteota archaeon]|nr:hypothetical protein [Thermoproteota archaeon]
MVPIIVPLIVGLLVSYTVKHTIKLIFVIAALVSLLVFSEVITISFQDILASALIETGNGLFTRFPYSSFTFIIGLALGLWKG